MSEEIRMLLFNLGRYKFACPVDKVREVINLQEITPTVEKDPNVEGVIDIRDEVIPIIDLRKLVGLKNLEVDEETRIIVFEDERRGIVIGLIVDSVTEIFGMRKNDIKKYNSEEKSKNTYVRGISKYKDNVILILDVPKVLYLGERT